MASSPVFDVLSNESHWSPSHSDSSHRLRTGSRFPRQLEFREGKSSRRLGVESMRYTVVLEQEVDGGYVVSVPALPGCVSQGDTRGDAIANIREAIDVYLADCRDAGDPVPTEAGKEFVDVDAA